MDGSNDVPEEIGNHHVDVPDVNDTTTTDGHGSQAIFEEPTNDDTQDVESDLDSLFVCPLEDHQVPEPAANTENDPHHGGSLGNDIFGDDLPKVNSPGNPTIPDDMNCGDLADAPTYDYDDFVKEFVDDKIDDNQQADGSTDIPMLLPSQIFGGGQTELDPDQIINSVEESHRQINCESLQEPWVLPDIEDSSSLFVPEGGDSSPTQIRVSTLHEAMPVLPTPASSVSKPTARTRYGTSLSHQSETLSCEGSKPRQPGSFVKRVLNAQAHFSGKRPAEDLSKAHRSNLSAGRPGNTQADLEDRRAAMEFEKWKRYYKRVEAENNGKLSFKQDVEWMRIQAEEESRLKKRQLDLELENEVREEEDGESGLFPDISYGTQAPNEPKKHAGDEAPELDFIGPRKRQRNSNINGASKFTSMQQAEMQSMMAALDAAKDMPRSKRRNRGKQSEKLPSTINPKASKSSNTKKGKKETRAREAAKHRRNLEAARTQAISLLASDVFQQQAPRGAPEQPSFNSRRKDDALKEIIAGFSMDLATAKQDANTLLMATRDFTGRGSVKPDNGLWRVKGMKTSLRPYQLLGAAWMRNRENSVSQPHGGLLADQMGLGKTLQMLANIVNGKPPRGAAGPRTTLLVANPALLGQWATEIEKHTDQNCLRVIRYSCGARVDSNCAAEILESHDVVLTTYNEVMKSYPKYDPPVSCTTELKRMEWWQKVYNENRGQLHRMKYHRVVLDEAQSIKDHKSRTSIACRGLMAKHRWAISGTPILNSLGELYPYFKFIGVPHTGDFEVFKHNYCGKGDKEAAERLLVRLSQFMLRRTHADKMFGAPILKLPPAEQRTFWGLFNPVERCVYDIVRARFAEKVNAWTNNGEFNKSYGNILVMLLRLRQLCSHILMLQFVMRDLLELEDVHRIEQVIKDYQTADPDSDTGRTIIAIRKQLTEVMKDDIGQRDQLEDSDYEDTPTPATGTETGDDFDELDIADERQRSGRSFGKKYDFNPFIASLKQGPEHEQRKKKAACSYCSDPLKMPMIMSCGHSICREPCLELRNLEAAEQGQSFAACDNCGAIPTFIHAREEEPDCVNPVSQGTRANKKTGKQCQSQVSREDFPKNWLDNIDENLLPSAKTIAIKAQIMNWMKENPDVKIIIYTQFLAMVRILAKICHSEGWRAEEYTGKMSFQARNKSLEDFANNEDARILLASLRCGGLGLNLTMAQRVIIVDPWWNSAAEQQAFCRVFRIGQKHDTFLSRICIRGSIDERLIEMQDEKRKEIDQVMEDPGKKIWSDKDLMRLFGNTDENPSGNRYIIVDDPEPTQGFVCETD